MLEKTHYYEPFRPTGVPFRKRYSPSEFETALGTLVISFQELEAVVAVAVGSLLRIDSSTTDILTAELPFRTKLHTLAALTRQQAATELSPDPSERLVRLAELMGLCFFLESERNRFIHSFWPLGIRMVPARSASK